ncbi:MerR family transcriptional regulator, partial [Pediococcus acidilactici]
MLKISEMAKLADTTRRTLIFYDEKDVFKPARKTSTGYRYYTYDQLYDLMFIRGLRSLDIPLDKIKKIKNTNEATSELLA